MQGKNTSHAMKDLYEAIERGKATLFAEAGDLGPISP
ncbi:hypothetical protein [Paenibacillus sp. SYP-B3998]